MCCFSGPVVEVANTNIFARASSDGRQFLVYQMELRAATATAMILPLPVPARSPEDAVRFIDLSAYPDFFSDLHAPFRGPPSRSNTRTGGAAAAIMPLPKLEVHRVGSFEASFVPSRDDFIRLDERFRLPGDAWDALPAVRDWGFAVFKLLDVVADQATAIEPMALELPRRDPGTLFFPAVHIHDGRVHAIAHYDHNLYLQAPDDEAVVTIGNHARRAASAPAPLHQIARIADAAGILDPRQPLQAVRFAGDLPNHDAVSAAPAPVLPPDVTDLRAWRAGDAPLPARQAAGLVARLAAARASALVSPRSVAASVALVDFMPSAQQSPGFIPYEAIYGSPELIMGELMDERTEVYEIGALAYHMAAGRPPFGKGWQAVVGHIKEKPALLGEPALDAVLQRALAKDPAQRFPSLRELAAALASV